MNKMSDNCTRSLEIPTSRTAGLFWRTLAIVLLVETAAIGAFYGFDWIWLRQIHIFLIRAAHSALGCQIQVAGTLLTIKGYQFQIDRDCTYVDLIICSLPLLWRVRRRWQDNLRVLVTFAACVAVVNLVRVVFGVYALTNGVSVFWAHDLEDYVLWYPTMCIVALLWMRNLRALWPYSYERHMQVMAEKSKAGNQKSETEVGLLASAHEIQPNQSTSSA